MNLKFYIESGILEQYALGLLSEKESANVKHLLSLYVELREELERIQDAMENYAALKAVQPRAHVKNLVIDSIVNLQKEKIMDLNNLPLINKFSDYKNWLGLVDTLGEIPLAKDGKFVKVLRHDAKVTQMLIVSSTAIEEETHEDEQQHRLWRSGERVAALTIAGGTGHGEVSTDEGGRGGT